MPSPRHPSRITADRGMATTSSNAWQEDMRPRKPYVWRGDPPPLPPGYAEWRECLAAQYAAIAAQKERDDDALPDTRQLG